MRTAQLSLWMFVLFWSSRISSLDLIGNWCWNWGTEILFVYFQTSFSLRFWKQVWGSFYWWKYSFKTAMDIFMKYPHKHLTLSTFKENMFNYQKFDLLNVFCALSASDYFNHRLAASAAQSFPVLAPVSEVSHWCVPWLKHCSVNLFDSVEDVVQMAEACLMNVTWSFRQKVLAKDQTRYNSGVHITVSGVSLQSEHSLRFIT